MPTETEAIDAFLSGVREALDTATMTPSTVIQHAIDAYSHPSMELANYAALTKVKGELLEITTRPELSEEALRRELESTLVSVMKRRGALRAAFRELGPSVIPSARQILMYSHSLRVVELLTGVSREVQSGSRLHIAECRPKSMRQPFGDAQATVEALSETNYSFTLVPDSVGAALLTRKRVSLLLLGAHAVYTQSGELYAFINTSGTEALLHVARDADIPTVVIAESDKVLDLAEHARAPLEEAEMSFPAGELIGKGTTDLWRTSLFTISYDLCSFFRNVRLVTEAGSVTRE
jgi:translation initiation factor 2B subunit (eIF-2B alpha/beta/delta family)